MKTFFWARILVTKVLISKGVNFQKDDRDSTTTREFYIIEILTFFVPIQLKRHNSKTVLDFTLCITTFDFLEFFSPGNVFLGRIFHPFSIRSWIYRVVSFLDMVDHLKILESEETWFDSDSLLRRFYRVKISIYRKMTEIQITRDSLINSKSWNFPFPWN
mgnify:CR=1 FL=1